MTPARHRRSQGALGRLVYEARAHPRIALAVIVGVGVGSWALCVALFPSDMRRITRTLDAVRDAVVAGDSDAALEHFAPEFATSGLDKRSLGLLLREALRYRPVLRAGYVVQGSSISKVSAQLHLVVFSRQQGEQGAGPARSEWDVALVPGERGQWLIQQAEPIEVNDLRMGGLRSILNFAIR